ncbi:MAG TPA: methyltransferase domain-containing protein [Methylibium sp.]|uniref:methyltransferase domain-containing protein n=1 Tax=Methylibium sp. TaxID=2067992 RepID=UPI002DBCC5D3|nr:methyltransferase domain-containing protein [Methylibium sp.]HEU4459088.1 methyltransferase domain-containing protein [Methylibium sp.]
MHLDTSPSPLAPPEPMPGAGLEPAFAADLPGALRSGASLLRRCTAVLLDRRSADRRLLEDVILAHYARSDAPLSLLSVGTHLQSRGYEALLPRHRYVTVDRDPAMACYGSSQRHVVGALGELGDALEPQSFDVVLMNGVIGWGLDDVDSADRALRELFRVLRPGGELIVGWNDRPGRRPFALEALPALRLFHRTLFRPLRAATVCVPGWRRHRYDFFRKPCADTETRPSVHCA